MIDLEREADEKELAFMQSVRGIHSAKDEEHMKQMLHEYLDVLKLMRLKRSVNHIAMADNWRIPPELEIYFPRTVGG